ncbi:MAG: Hpt domain-containing protein [Bdellovibrionota bacterium]
MTVVNVKAALELLEGDRELYRRAVTVYLQDTPMQLAKLETWLKTNDLKGAERRAHALKSASRTVGAEDLGALCARLESSVHEGNLVEAEKLFEAVRLELDKVRVALETELAA